MTDTPVSTPRRGVTQDFLLDRRVVLYQPEHGYRVAIDPVFLAAAVPVRSGERVLELGAGVGAASLCLAARVPACRITGIEIDEELAGLARDNIARNGLADRVSIHHGDLREPLPDLLPASFHHVMANPPFLPISAATVSPVRAKTRANFEDDTDLTAWVRAALLLAQPKGTLSFIYRADRMQWLLAELAGHLGEIIVYPLWPSVGKDAKRIIVHARKGVSTPTRIASGLILHEADGRFTEAAQSVLRLGAPLPLGIPPA